MDNPRAEKVAVVTPEVKASRKSGLLSQRGTSITLSSVFRALRAPVSLPHSVIVWM